MKILAFGSATPECSVALRLGDQSFKRFESKPRQHSSKLLAMMDDLLRESDCSLSDLDVIAISEGPGSFMGLRMAAGLAQGLAYGLDLPVVTVSSLQAMAQSAYWQTKASCVLPMLDARLSSVYFGAYQSVDGVMMPIGEDALFEPQNLVIPQQSNSWLAVGSAWAVYENAIPDSVQNTVTVSEVACYPDAKAIAYLAAKKVALDQGALSPDRLKLKYLRNKIAKTTREREQEEQEKK